MNKKRSPFIVRLLKLPEVQFFLVFAAPFTVFFATNFIYFEGAQRVAATISFLAILTIVLLQTIYEIHAHRRLKNEESSFVRVTAHQIRTPLTALNWALEEIKGAKNEQEKEELFETAKVAALKIANLVEGFDDLAKVASEGALSFNFEEADLTEFLTKLVHESGPVAKQHGVRLILDVPHQDIIACIDGAKLDMALSNILNNGIMYNHKNGTVAVRLRMRGDAKTVDILIEDSGMGISKLDQERIFNRFFRAADARKMRPEGSGLGLYLSNMMVRAHGGSIEVRSVYGRGTTFVVKLPMKICVFEPKG